MPLRLMFAGATSRGEDHQPMVLPGLEGHVVMIATWPMVTVGNLLEPPDCNTVPVANQ